MHFFNDISDIKEYVGGAINQSVDESSLAPIVYQVLHAHIVPYLGSQLVETLETKQIADTLSPVEAALVKHIQRTLAWLTVNEYVSIGSVQLSDAGLLRSEGDNMKTAFKYQENNFRDSSRIMGYNALEQMLLYCYKEVAQFPDLIAADYEQYRLIVPNLLSFARDMANAYGRKIDRYTFESMRGIVEDVELFAIIPALGRELYKDLYLRAHFNFTLNPDHEFTDIYKKLYRLCIKAVSSFTIAEAITANLVQIKGNSLYTAEGLGDQTSIRESIPNSNALQHRLDQQTLLGNRYIREIIDYLKTKEEDFPNWTPFTIAEPDEEVQTQDIASNPPPQQNPIFLF